MSFVSIILAAGQGTRMLSNLPKVLHRIAGAPMIDYILNAASNIKENIVVLGPEMDAVSAHIRDKFPSVKFAVQHHRLGTADAVKVGIAQLKNPEQDTFILYGDVPFIRAESLKDMQAILQEDYSKTALVLLGFMSNEESAYGRLVLKSNGNLQQIVEYLDCTEEEKKIRLCNQGAMLINKHHRDRLISKVRNNNAKKEFYLTDLIAIANEEGLQCKYMLVDQKEATAINTRSELAVAENIMQNLLREKFLSSGVTLIDPDTVYFSNDTIIENDVVIQPNVFFGPAVKVQAGAQIKAFSHIEGADIGPNAIVGPFARIRPGTKLNQNVHVGNFVEIKNSTVDDETKINHLTYVGDAKIGSKVNIGAGTIVCNYDGVSKHETIIKDGAFIGSNTTLVAPVSIGAHSLVAAGSTITNDVDKNALSIARAVQQNVPGKAAEILNKKRKNIAL